MCLILIPGTLSFLPLGDIFGFLIFSELLCTRVGLSCATLAWAEMIDQSYWKNCSVTQISQASTFPGSSLGLDTNVWRKDMTYVHKWPLERLKALCCHVLWLRSRTVASPCLGYFPMGKVCSCHDSVLFSSPFLFGLGSRYSFITGQRYKGIKR